MRLEEVIEKLELFNESVAKLERKGFLEKARTSGVGFSIQFSVDQPGITGSIKRFGPNEDEIDAFVLTCRLFVRDGDGISLRKIAEYYNDYLPVRRELIDHINWLRERWNEYLDSDSFVTLNTRTIKLSEIFDVFLWGAFAHVNPDKKQIYDQWTRSPSMPYLSNEFVKILIELRKIVRSIREVNRLSKASIIVSCFWAGDTTLAQRDPII